MLYGTQILKTQIIFFLLALNALKTRSDIISVGGKSAGTGTFAPVTASAAQEGGIQTLS